MHAVRSSRVRLVKDKGGQAKQVSEVRERRDASERTGNAEEDLT